MGGAVGGSGQRDGSCWWVVNCINSGMGGWDEATGWAVVAKIYGSDWGGFIGGEIGRGRGAAALMLAVNGLDVAGCIGLWPWASMGWAMVAGPMEKLDDGGAAAGAGGRWLWASGGSALGKMEEGRRLFMVMELLPIELLPLVGACGLLLAVDGLDTDARLGKMEHRNSVLRWCTYKCTHAM
ncbi:hypothetical protein ACLOJK_034398 [Asimina triloba]